MQPALVLLELDSVAVGTETADAMVKRAPISDVRAGTVQPGKYLILVRGSVAAVEEAYLESLRRSGDALVDHIFLPHVHEQVQRALDGHRRSNTGDALGVMETSTMPANVRAADRAVKTADVDIVEIRLGDGLGGKGVTYLTGKVEEVEAAVQAGVASVDKPEFWTRSVVIPAQHGDIRDLLDQSGSVFGHTIRAG